MNSFIQNIILVLATLTLAGQILSALILLSLAVFLLSKSKKTIFYKVIKFFGQNSTPFSLIVATVATVGSLFLSEVAHFIPCQLCWYQRILMYPQVVVAGVGLLANDKVAKYLLPLSIIGILISTYNYFLQLFPNLLQCSDEVAKCSTIQFASFGYITIPVMAGTAFLMIILFNVSSVLLDRKS